MKLEKILQQIKYELIYGEVNKDIEGVSCKSNECKNNYIFVAIKGFEADGHNFIKDAVERGAKVVFYNAYRGIDLKEFYGKNLTFIKVKDTRFIFSQLCNIFYEFPSKNLKLIGITGTNGKTTVTYLLERLLPNCGVIGTVNYRFKDIIYTANNTTPDPCEINRIFKEFYNNGAEHIAMEVSSHAMEMDRVEGLDFDIGIFTNLTSEHLDFHKNMENYFNAKSKFFTITLKNSNKENKVAIINIDDNYGNKLISLIDYETITYSIDNNQADIFVKDYKAALDGTFIDMKIFNKSMLINTNLIGLHNIYNILSSVACAYILGIPFEKIKKAFQKEIVIPGRMERVIKDRNIFIDYAHTEDALKNVLSCLKSLKKNKNRIITVFGCGGDRDKSKRPKMGEVAAIFSDFLVITSDNPRREDPLQIIDNILEGVKGKIPENNYRVIPDRKDAIEMSLKLAKKEDIVLIAGKGHEDYQIIGTEKKHFSDKEVVLNFFNKGENV